MDSLTEDTTMSKRNRIVLMMILALAAVAPVGCTVSPQVMRQRGDFHFERKEYDQAKPWYEQLVRADPTAWDAHYGLGVIALQEDDAATARRHLEIAYALVQDKPKRVQPIIDGLAEAMYRQKEYPQLFGFLGEVTQRYGTVHDYIRKGSYLYRYGDHDAAVVAYRQGARMAGADDPTPYQSLGAFYAKLGHKRQAILEYRRAYTLDPENKEVQKALLDLGVVPGPTIHLAPDQLPRP